jgi:hypothetical protein
MSNLSLLKLKYRLTQLLIGEKVSEEVKSGFTTRAVVASIIVSIITMTLYELNAFLIGGYGPAWEFSTSPAMGAFLWALPVFLVVGLISSKN